MDVVLVTRDRPELTEQCIRSMRENSVDWSKHRLVVIFDGTDAEYVAYMESYNIPAKLRAHFGDAPPNTRYMIPEKQLGVGGAKNRGADWFRHQGPDDNDVLMFSDNDLFYLPEWDEALPRIMTYGLPDERWPDSKPKFHQLGGWRHPYHGLGQKITKGTKYAIHEVDAVTGNCFVMRWSDWLRYGPFDANAIGPGQSEDYALSQRIRAGGGLVATLDPPVAIHCGLVNSVGEPATGWREMEVQITEQLAGLSAEMRNDILIMRPGDIGIGPPSPAYERPAGGLRGIAARTARITEESRHRLLRNIEEATTPTFEDARDGLDMHPRDPLVPARKPDRIIPRREITLDEAMRMFPHYDRSPRLQGCNAGSGQRRFETTPEVCWTNLDLVDRPPDQVPDIVGDARHLDAIFPLNSLDYVVSHHLHEHLGHGEADPITRAAYHVLRAGGSLLVFTPDARKLAGRWLGGELDDFQFAVQMMGAYQGEEGDRHRWTYTQETLERSLADAAPWREVKPFDWRTIPGADLARDWYIAAVECVK